MYFFNIRVNNLQYSSQTEHILASWGYNAMSPYCLGGWILVVVELNVDVELAGPAATHATHQWGGVTRSSSRLLAGASIVEAHRLGGACMQLDGAPVAGSMRKARQHGRTATSAPLFRIEVIDGGDWHVAPARPLSSSHLPYGRCIASGLRRRSPRFEGEGGNDVRVYRRERESWC
jgi:hypothetical protein